MKFDKLCKLILNEKDYAGGDPEENREFDELQTAMSKDTPPEETPNPVGDVGNDVGDDVNNDTDNVEELSSMPETRDEQIEYLVKTLPKISRLNRTKSIEALTKMANELIDDDLFETVYKAHEELMAEPVSDEELPEDLSTDAPIRGAMGDEPDVPGLTEYEKEQRAMDRFREEEEGLMGQED